MEKIGINYNNQKIRRTRRSLRLPEIPIRDITGPRIDYIIDSRGFVCVVKERGIDVGIIEDYKELEREAVS